MLVVDSAAGGVVRLGGLAVIVAVLGILVFLVATVLPLFQAGDMRPREGAAPSRVPVDAPLACLAVDEYRMLALAVGATPEVVAFRPDTGEVVARFPVPYLAGARVAVAERTARSDEAVVASEGGRLAFLDFGFETDFVLDASAGALRASLAPGQAKVVDTAVVRRVAGGNLLRVRAQVAERGGVSLPEGAATIVAVGYATHGETGAAIAVTLDRQVHVVAETVTKPLIGPAERAYAASLLPQGDRKPPGETFAALVDEEIRLAWLVGRGGELVRIDLRSDPLVIRESTLAVDAARQIPPRLSSAAFVLGGRSLVTCDEEGGTSIWSLVPAPGSPTGDEREIRRLHVLPRFSSPAVTVVSGSTRRTLYFGHADGGVTAAYSTNQRILATTRAFPGPIASLAPSSKDDGLVVVGPDLSAKVLDFECAHPETSAGALFGKVHYEGYAAPSYLYQSTSGTDEAETKLSLVPLLYGTVKATFYALIVALPLALLAALYTSQFMSPRVRGVVKPAIEVMASLPSVVLGFLAGLVIAPFVENVVPAVLAATIAVPVAGFLAGIVWHAIPPEVTRRIPSSGRLGIAVALVAGVLAAAWAGNGALQSLLFSGPANPSGDFRVWLRGAPGTGSARPLLGFGLFAMGAAAGAWLLSRRLSPLGAAAAGGALLAALTIPVEAVVFGGDFRRFLLGPEGQIYDQKNSLVVGIAMGFAVIPVIYTIAEDALSAIPQSLRSAALACGASPWQTALRVVVPAAAPGIFSAAMIGLGRAVGETMIVVMATGNTAILDPSPFNGFRTLSANVATEMPEAPQGGTLYRVLFLAGLLLFALTFVVNTAAEIVRIRFRRRFKAL